jgi:nitrate reductase gamma subunit
MSDFLYFSEHTLQEVALLIMGIVYLTRLYWLFSFKAGSERQAPTGNGSNKTKKSVLYSWGIIAMPWAMESTRKNIWIYVQFVIFHLGVAAAILLSFIIPYAPGMLESGAVVLGFQIVICSAFAVGILRIIRRVSNPYMRAISSPDDHFSLALLTVWFAFAAFAATNDTSGGEWILLTYFLLTAFFLIYVPFSKISHYLYYPITRYYFGKTMGYRGVYPIKKDSSRNSVLQT